MADQGNSLFPGNTNNQAADKAYEASQNTSNLEVQDNQLDDAFIVDLSSDAIWGGSEASVLQNLHHGNASPFTIEWTPAPISEGDITIGPVDEVLDPVAPIDDFEAPSIVLDDLPNMGGLIVGEIETPYNSPEGLGHFGAGPSSSIGGIDNPPLGFLELPESVEGPGFADLGATRPIDLVNEGRQSEGEGTSSGPGVDTSPETPVNPETPGEPDAPAEPNVSAAPESPGEPEAPVEPASVIEEPEIVEDVNLAPIAGDVDLGAFNEDGFININKNDLLSNSFDADGDTLEITNLTLNDDVGTLEQNGQGAWRFTPNENYNGDDVSFSFEVSDGEDTASANAVVDVSAVNDGPEATDIDLGATNEDTAIVFTDADLLAGASDIDGDDLSIASVTLNDAVGSLSDDGNGNYTFTPNENYNGDDVSFSFEVSDGEDTASANAVVDVSAVNDGPEATDIDLGATNEDTAIVFTDADLLAGASDIDGDDLSIASVTLNDAVGSLSDDGNGNYTFTPNENYNGDDVSFSFEVSDGEDTASANAVVDVSAVNDGPEATDIDLGATNEDTAIVFTDADLLAGASDIDGDDLSIASVTLNDAVGSLSDDGNGNYTFTPNENYNGDDVSFSFEVSDGEDTASANATLDVTAIADNPDLSVSVTGISSDGQTVAVGGTEGDDVIDTGNGKDEVFAGAGDDVITGGNAKDTIHGGDGNDTIDSGNGMDVVTGGSGDDIIDGGSGNDVIYGDGGPVTSFAVDITTSLSDTDGSESLSIQVSGLPEGAELSAGTDLGGGEWSLTEDDLDDLQMDVPEGTGAFELTVSATSTEGDGGDQAVTSQSVSVDPEAGGGTGDDVIIGGQGNDQIYGGGGDDTIEGNQGNEVISGGAG